MRDIWFKAKKISDGEWVEGFYVMYSTSITHPYSHTNGDHYIITVPHNYKYQVDPETVRQYTGLTDKNEKKIFEGDIVKAGEILVVSWKEKLASWCLCKKRMDVQSFLW